MDLPLGVKVLVFQRGNYLDVQVSMTKEPEQDGVCGNFNGNHGDDSTQTIMTRIGARVRPEESMLSGKPAIEFTPQMDKMLAAECAAATRASGRETCARLLGGASAGEAEVKSCTFDMCFGMNVHARRHAKTYR